MRVNRNDSSINAFLALIRAGLWENFPVHGEGLMVNGSSHVDWVEVYRLATEQSVMGLVLVGIEKTNTNRTDNTNRLPQELLLQWIGEVQIIEEQNKAMNSFIAEIVENMRKADIYTLLVKGQGIAQCYERPLWRASGDVDLYLSDTNFEKAKKYFRPLVPAFDPDNEYTQHINMNYDSWVVEIHGDQHIALSTKIDRVMDEIHQDLFYGRNVRNWQIGNTQVFLPSSDNDVIIIFAHFLKHFYKGGLGLRQICDWCRLLWTYRDSLNHGLLESRIRKMGLVNVWKGFAAFAVDYLGMPKDAMPLYSADKKWKRKADRICSFILEVGNFGHNRDSSYYENESRMCRKYYSFRRRCGDMLHHARIFPLETLRFFPNMVYYGLTAVAKGE